MRHLSIVDWPFRGCLLGIGAFALVGSWFVRQFVFRWLARLLALMIAVASVGLAINAHYFYFPTVGALFGRRAADQISTADLQRIVSVPSHGVVLPFVMPPTVSHFPVHTGQVYLPPIYFTHPRPRLPVVELLHGSPGSPSDWTRAAFADLTADDYARSHHGFAPILVMPDINGKEWWNDSECVDGPRGNAETYVTIDVRNAVIKAFGARADGGGWAVAGLSEGGSCALQIGLRHPDEYSAIGDFSGDDHPWVGGGLRALFWGFTEAQLQASERAYDPRVLLADWHGSGPTIVFAIGSHDSLIRKMRHLDAEARADHLHTEFYVIPGGHTFRLWGKAFAAALPTFMSRLAASGGPRIVRVRAGCPVWHRSVCGSAAHKTRTLGICACPVRPEAIAVEQRG